MCFVCLELLPFCLKSVEIFSRKKFHVYTCFLHYSKIDFLSYSHSIQKIACSKASWLLKIYISSPNKRNSFHLCIPENEIFEWYTPTDCYKRGSENPRTKCLKITSWYANTFGTMNVILLKHNICAIIIFSVKQPVE